MDRCFPSHQVKSGKKTVQAENMVAVEMAYKNMIDLSEPDFTLPELHLCSFSTVDQKQTLMYIKHMSGWISC